MQVSGNLKKMSVKLKSEVEYLLQLEDSLIMNDLIGKKIRFEYDGQINCIDCGRKTKKSFAQGFCYPCYLNSPMNSECIINPELCEGHLGGGRDPEWEVEHHVRPHYVYLALTSAIKVGVTREDQIPTRWIDQGAWKALIIAKTENRRQAGEIEVKLKKKVTDKTNWRSMLKDLRQEDADLQSKGEELMTSLPAPLKKFMIAENDITEINYPVRAYPSKVNSIGFDKNAIIEGNLTGIRGQYLIFDNDNVLNIRKHNGYFVKLSY